MQTWLDGLQTVGSFIFDTFGRLLDFLADQHPFLLALFFSSFAVTILVLMYSIISSVTLTIRSNRDNKGVSNRDRKGNSTVSNGTVTEVNGELYIKY